MKNAIFIIFGAILILVSACDKKKNNYTVYWEGNNLCAVMPHPTSSIVVLGQTDWRGVELSEVVEDIYNELQKTKLSGNVLVWVRFEMLEHDKYGNEVISYDDHFLTNIPIPEAKKFKSGNFLDMEYHLKKLIEQSAFPTDIYSTY